MTIRWKLNAAMLAMLVTFMAAGAVVVHSVNRTTQTILDSARLRELSVFTDDVRAQIFYQLALQRGMKPLYADEVDIRWPDDVIEDIEIRISHAKAEVEQTCWTDIRSRVYAMTDMEPDDDELGATVKKADSDLRLLRRHYDHLVGEAMARTGDEAARLQFVMLGGALLSIGLFAIMSLYLRDWFVKPIDQLNKAAAHFGKGELDHRVEFMGHDELARLADGFNDMADKLTMHQKELIESRELAAIGEICSNVAHGLRNPLASIRASAQLGGRFIDDPEQLNAILGELISEVDRMDKRITRLFQFSRRKGLCRTPTSFAELMDEAKSEVRGTLEAKHVELELEDETAGHSWLIDRQQLGAAVGELLANAAHHSPEHATVRVQGKLTPSGNSMPPELTVNVYDSGRGMSPEELRQAFDLFYTTRDDGSGMGLALVRRVVDQHKGSIQLASTQGVGSLVTLVVGRT
jgi:signal transduction histidine kinase